MSLYGPLLYGNYKYLVFKCHYMDVTLLQQEESKVKVDELSEMSSKLMVQNKGITKLKEDNKLLVKYFRDRKQKRRREIIAQVYYY